MLTDVAGKKLSSTVAKRIGARGGRKRAAVLSRERRREIAASGAKAYWAKYRELRELKVPAAKPKRKPKSDARQEGLF